MRYHIMPKLNFTYLHKKKLDVQKQTDFYDTVTPGLGLRVNPGGSKTFFYRYRHNNKNRRYTINRYTSNFTVTDARSKVDELRSKVRNGKDPVGEQKAKKEKPDSINFQKLHEIYQKIHLVNLRESTRKYHNWVMSSKILPILNGYSINEISKKHIVRVLDKIAINDDAQTTANKARSRLHHVFEFGIQRGYLTINPVSGTKPYKGGNNQRERYYHQDEIKKIWQAVENLNEPVQSYMKIIMLTGQRRSETLYMKWEDVHHISDNDFEGWVWVIPKELAKSKREHTVPLPPTAFEVIDGLRQDYNPYVFASRFEDDIPIGLKTVKRAVKNIKDNAVVDFRLHDMRRTVATQMAKLGTSADVLSKILNHTTGGSGSLVTRIYNRYQYRTEMLTALTKWADVIQQLRDSQ